MVQAKAVYYFSKLFSVRNFFSELQEEDRFLFPIDFQRRLLGHHPYSGQVQQLPGSQGYLHSALVLP